MQSGKHTLLLQFLFLSISPSAAVEKGAGAFYQHRIPMTQAQTVQRPHMDKVVTNRTATLLVLSVCFHLKHFRKNEKSYILAGLNDIFLGAK